MIIIPAIDIKGGRCVRLRQGVMADETVYADDPTEVARRWEREGAELIHLVDIDGAIDGQDTNFSVVEEISKAVSVPLEIGGGIRDRAIAERYLSINSMRQIILGTVALEKPEFVSELAAENPGRIAVGIDAKDGMVAVKGWVDVTDVSATELAKELTGAGVSAIIYTDISRDGMLTGPNIEATVDLAAEIDIPVIASGGMAKLADVEAYKRASEERSVELLGIIVGRALYTGDIDLPEAISAL